MPVYVNNTFPVQLHNKKKKNGGVDYLHKLLFLKTIVFTK